MSDWILYTKLASETGYTPEALRKKCTRGLLTQGSQWRKAPDGRIIINRNEFQRWLLSAEQV